MGGRVESRDEEQEEGWSRKGETEWEGKRRGVQSWHSQGSQSTGTKPIIRADKYSVTEVRAWLT